MGRFIDQNTRLVDVQSNHIYKENKCIHFDTFERKTRAYDKINYNKLVRKKNNLFDQNRFNMIN